MFTCSKCKEFILLKTDGIFMMGRKWHKKCWNCGTFKEFKNNLLFKISLSYS